MKRRALSVVEANVLDAIANAPGKTPVELAEIVAAPQSTMSAVTARLLQLKQVNRLKVKGTATFRYFPRDAALPEGAPAWQNALVRTAPKGRRNGHAQNGAPAVDDVLLTFPVGHNETVVLTIANARRLYEQLAALFGERA